MSSDDGDAARAMTRFKQAFAALEQIGRVSGTMLLQVRHEGASAAQREDYEAGVRDMLSALARAQETLCSFATYAIGIARAGDQRVPLTPALLDDVHREMLEFLTQFGATGGATP